MAECSRRTEKSFRRTTGVTVGISLAMLAAGAMTAADVATATPSKSSGTVIGLRHSPNGKVLDGTARKFAFVHVTAAGKNVGCNTVCQTIWAMVKTSGKPRAGHGVKPKRLGQTSAHQVTYHGHPLFYYSPSPKSASIDGAQSFNGHWRLINAKGKFR